ncbi:hypothetical protein TSUD_106850 [Trifolium subterraneum]|uniref:poly(A)-specific ribonuclease n=1 Tax=Trifolium subterraneum TaxID=3900 RepID=A0A2Z6MZQ4_TRISU|nr:hypothetical protein TSUD_106850 [Trifolium subterraneum]
MNKPVLIRQVWASNLEAEFRHIRNTITRFPVISMDTEFPGVIYAPNFDPAIPYYLRNIEPSEQYKFLKKNVNDLKLIQLGLTLSDGRGNLPDLGTGCCYVWEFNFSDFDPENDPRNQDSVDLLRRQGIDFNRNLSYGVDSKRFAQLMETSGLLYKESVVWVTFHSAYDFGYLVKVLTQRDLPDQLEDFLKELTRLFGRNVFDMKHVMKFCNSLYGGLERVATTLNVKRAIGRSHQAGSDSLLTWQAFKKMLDIYFVDNQHNNLDKHAGVLFGLEIAA